MLSQVSVMSASLSALNDLNKDSVSLVMDLVDRHQFDRVVVADNNGEAVYDSSENEEYTVGSPEDALTGNAVFRCYFDGDSFHSGCSAPIMSYGRVIGSVYVFEHDTEQGEIISHIQDMLRNISLVAGIVTLACVVWFTHGIKTRLLEILRLLRKVGAGDYKSRVKLRGKDEITVLGEEFNLMAERLDDTDTMRRRFVSDASHELRTPLASIRLLSDSIVQDESMDEGTMREFVSDIGSEAERLQRITEHLMRLTKMDNRTEVRKVPVDMKKEIERTLHLLSPLAATKDITLYSDLQEDCFVLSGVDDMYQVVFNLVENAIKYNDFGGNVFIRLSPEEGNIILSVEDTGIGIPEEDMEKVFTRFYRVDKARSRERGGSGLGLSIVHDTVIANKGTIEVSSRPTVGTAFVCTFPAYYEEENSL
ncbi:MAG: HAMP domain-containing histidine kinase [Oscillospiraceae bacterium]|nr:HAMP domain-containing histidine kinase [Oscillospiraceae bacterium]